MASLGPVHTVSLDDVLALALTGIQHSPADADLTAYLVVFKPAIGLFTAVR
jgi:hypothetical protein